MIHIVKGNMDASVEDSVSACAMNSGVARNLAGLAFSGMSGASR
jgi:hypothetical protein